MENGNFDYAIRQLIKRLVEGKSEPNISGFCEEVLYEWDKNRGNDWYAKEN